MILKLINPEVQQARSAMIPLTKHTNYKAQSSQSASISNHNNPELQQSQGTTIPKCNCRVGAIVEVTVLFMDSEGDDPRKCRYMS